jgi:4-hydroxy-tetrahydrodipicolinate reductase
MGSTVCRAVAADPDLELVAAVNPRLAGVGLEQAAGLPGTAIRVAPDLEGLAAAGAQVAVDFTTPSGALDNLRWCAGNGLHAVVGTTGLSAHLDELRSLFSGGRANCILAPNFAVGAVLMMRFAELAAPYIDSAEVVELHHDGKADAPSGTALLAAERLAAARAASGAGPLSADPTTIQTLPGTRGGEGPGGVRIHSLRLHGLVAHHEVVLSAAGQSLTIRHDSYDRTSFMPGVLLAIKRVSSLPGLTVGLESLLWP